MKLTRGTTSKLLRFFIQDVTRSDGGGLTGLTSASAGLIAYYIREGDNTTTVISLSAGTLGTWSSGGFVEVDATHMPGIYEVGIPNAALSTGNSVHIYLSGATNMAPTVKEIELDAFNYQSATVRTTYALVKNAALNNFEFVMFNSSGVPTTGLTVTGQASIDGAAFGSLTNAVAEVSNGVYKVSLAAADTNGNVITYRFSATGAADTFVTVVTQS